MFDTANRLRCAGQREPVNGSRAGRLDRDGAGVQRGAGRAHIVDQQYIDAAQRFSVAGKCASHVHFAIRRVERHLDGCGARAAQRLGIHRQGGDPTYASRQKFGLVVTALALALGMERHRHDRARRRLRLHPEASQGIAQRLGQRGNTPILEGVDSMAYRAIEQRQ